MKSAARHANLPGILERSPTPGFRYYANGTLCGVGHYGFSWVLSIPAGNSNAHNLHFYNGGIGPQNYGNRSYGFQVRCLQE